MLKITKNTYPKYSIGRFAIGTLCKWQKSETGFFALKKCDESGRILPSNVVKENDYTIDTNEILNLGQIYTKKGFLLSNKKEPLLVGLVAKYARKGWFLELKHVDSH